MLLFSALILVACSTARTGSTSTPGPEPTPPTPAGPVPTLDHVIPRPAVVTATGNVYGLTPSTRIRIDPATAELAAIGELLAGRLRQATGYAVQVLPGSGDASGGDILLTTAGADPELGQEGYRLDIAPEGVTLAAYRPEGVFRGVQTLRQLLPPSIESAQAQAGPWRIATGTIRDVPRFAWRGAMLDVARHFLGVDDVKRFIDSMAYYKLNRLHLHLTDDQGWRLAIRAWPRLTEVGGRTAVGGGAGGYYTQADYRDLIDYAQRRYITVIPEIDMPGHTNAALASYAELNCSGAAPELYSGTEVGFSSLCTSSETTYAFLEDVIREVAELTPGPYLHIGGDEAQATQADEYVRFIERVQAIVHAHGKQMIGWEEIGEARLLPESIVQHWHNTLALEAAQRGQHVILSPASKTYLDMKYDAATRLGQQWAGTISVREAYDWDPDDPVSGAGQAYPAGAVVGLEAPLWSETLVTLADVEYMAFPRLAGLAEIGWSPAGSRDWAEYRVRLAAHAPRLDALGVSFFRAPEVPWP